MATARYSRRPAALLHRRLVQYEMNDVRRLAELTTDLLRSDAAEREARLERVVAGMGEDDRLAYYDSQSDDYELFFRHIPNQHQYSLVVMTYSVFESRLAAIALGLLNLVQPGSSASRLPGRSVFFGAKTVIEERAALPVPARLWDEVDAYREVRNAIVHAAGEMPSVPVSVAQLLQDRCGDIQLKSGCLVIWPGLVVAFAHACEALLGSVLDEWQALEERLMSAAPVVGVAP